MSDYPDRQTYIERIFRDLINLLPTSYNKEVTDTNYSKLLNSLATELADARIQIDQVRQNTYLDTVNPDRIYPNFGIMVRLQKDPLWDDDQYNRLIQGVIQSLLAGPTKESLINALKLFTQFNVNVYELYKDRKYVDPAIYTGYNPQFTFVIEVQKPLDTYADPSQLIKNIQYVINVLKPAHTIGINVITLIGDEDYRRYWAIDRQIGIFASIYLNDLFQDKVNQLLSDSFSQDPTVIEEINTRANTNYQNYLNDLEQSLNPKNQNQLNVNSCGIIQVLDLNHFMIEATTYYQYQFPNVQQALATLKSNAFNWKTATLDDVSLFNLILNKKNELIAKYGSDPNYANYTNNQWFDLAVSVLTDEAFHEYVYDQLGGYESVFNTALTRALSFEDQLSTFYQTNTQYCGMDFVEVITQFDYDEGTYGYKHLTAPGCFVTSTNKSLIGGYDLIGPRFVLNDQDKIDFDDLVLDNVYIVQTPFELNFSHLNGSVLNGIGRDQRDTDELNSSVTDEYATIHSVGDRNDTIGVLDGDVFEPIAAKGYKPFTLNDCTLNENDAILLNTPRRIIEFDVDQSKVDQTQDNNELYGLVYLIATPFVINSDLIDSDSNFISGLESRDVSEITTESDNTEFYSNYQDQESSLYHENLSDDFRPTAANGLIPFNLNGSILNGTSILNDFTMNVTEFNIDGYGILIDGNSETINVADNYVTFNLNGSNLNDVNSRLANIKRDTVAWTPSTSDTYDTVSTVRDVDDRDVNVTNLNETFGQVTDDQTDTGVVGNESYDLVLGPFEINNDLINDYNVISDLRDIDAVEIESHGTESYFNYQDSFRYELSLSDGFVPTAANDLSPFNLNGSSTLDGNSILTSYQERITEFNIDQYGVLLDGNVEDIGLADNYVTFALNNSDLNDDSATLSSVPKDVGYLTLFTLDSSGNTVIISQGTV